MKLTSDANNLSNYTPLVLTFEHFIFALFVGQLQKTSNLKKHLAKFIICTKIDTTQKICMWSNICTK